MADKAAVERSLQITASKPVTGAWYWMNNKTISWGPERYWPAHTEVRFTAHLAGVQAAPGVFGQANLSQHFPDRQLAGGGGQHGHPLHEGVDVKSAADRQLADQHRAGGEGKPPMAGTCPSPWPTQWT